MPDNTLHYVRARHPDDTFYDEIALTGPNIAARTFPRWKQSHLSGDEWRISSAWVRLDESRIVNSLSVTSNVLTAIEMLGVDLTECSSDFGAELVESVVLMRKGSVLHVEQLSVPTELRIAAGMITGIRHEAAWKLDISAIPQGLCDQPGCKEVATVAYRQKSAYTPDGHPYTRRSEAWGWIYIRRFCDAHKTRGDCGLDDCDENYEEIELTEEIMRASAWHRPAGFDRHRRDGLPIVSSTIYERSVQLARARPPTSRA